MSKHLRLVRDRRDSNENDETQYTGAELRGLGDRELFQASGMTARLRVYNPPSDETLATVFRDYPVAVVERSAQGENDPWIELGSPRPSPGEHKKHALTLFVAAMALHRHDPRCRSFIHHVHGLAHLLQSRIPGTFSASVPQVAQLAAFASSGSRFSVDGMTRHTLHQVGLPVEPGTELLHFTDEALTRMHERLVSPSQAATGRERKAA